MQSKYQPFRVVMGKAGTIYAGNNFMQAMASFERGVRASKQTENVHSGCGLILLHNGTIKREYVGNAGESSERIEA